jgi:hypothetical protein
VCSIFGDAHFNRAQCSVSVSPWVYFIPCLDVGTDLRRNRSLILLLVSCWCTTSNWFCIFDVLDLRARANLGFKHDFLHVLGGGK